MLWHLQLIYQLNRFLALQALVECLGICIATFGLKFPILLNSTILGILDPILLNSTILGILDQMWLYIYLDIQLGPAGLKTCSIDKSIEGATTSRPAL